MGPDWLAKSEDEWPSGKVTDKTASVLEEECKSVINVVEVKESARVSNLINLKNYGVAEDLFRLTAWVLRFVFNVRAKARNTDRHRGDLKADELVEAENLWIKDAQMELKTDKKYPQLSNSLGLMEEEGILLCKGRFKNSDLEFNTKHPIIMPKDHRLTELLVEKCHSEVPHCGVWATLSRMRTKYWVVKGRQMIKKVIGRCITCKRLKGKPCNVTQMANLPEFRVKQAAPFSKVGIDFAGPLFVKCGAKCSSKAYIALFSCCVTGAIHLQLEIYLLRHFFVVYADLLLGEECQT